MVGEQTFFKSGKTAGGITNFASRTETIQKWVFNQHFQARFGEALLELTYLEKTTTSTRKCLRDREILKSNGLVMHGNRWKCMSSLLLLLNLLIKLWTMIDCIILFLDLPSMKILPKTFFLCHKQVLIYWKHYGLNFIRQINIMP